MVLFNAANPSLRLGALAILCLMLAGACAHAAETPSSAVATPVSVTPTASGSSSTAMAPSSFVPSSSTSSQDAPNQFAPSSVTPNPFVPNAPAPGPLAPNSQTSTRSPAGIGNATRGLLHAQAEGRNAGPAQPMLGSVASASYQRYVDSFKYPIPIFFGTTVDTDSGQ